MKYLNIVGLGMRDQVPGQGQVVSGLFFILYNELETLNKNTYMYIIFILYIRYL